MEQRAPSLTEQWNEPKRIVAEIESVRVKEAAKMLAGFMLGQHPGKDQGCYWVGSSLS